MSDAICVRGLTKSYSGRAVLNHLDLSVKAGTVFGLLGANGAGKSTAIECMLGTKTADSGAVRLLGQDPKRQRRELFEKIGVQFQEGDYQQEIKVFELCEETACLYRDPADWKELCSRFGIGDKLKNTVKSLSGGERQRVFIARAVAQRPRVMLLDEPTSNLDMRFQLETMEIVKALSAGRGITVITILHDLNLAIVYADQAVLLRDGTVYRAQSPQEALDGANIRDIFGVEVGFAPLDGARYIVPRRLERG